MNFLKAEMMKKWTLALISCVCFGLTAQEVNIPHISKPNLDGIVSPSEWQGAYRTNLVELSGKKPREATCCFMGCDEKNLYLAFICSESLPSASSANAASI